MKIVENAIINFNDQPAAEPHKINFEISRGENYYYIDIYGYMKIKTYRKDIEDNMIIDTLPVFINLQDAQKYKYFWDMVQDYQRPFKPDQVNACILVSPQDHELIIATTKINNPNLIYFDSIDAAKEFVANVGGEDSKTLPIWRIEMYAFLIGTK